MEALSVVEPVDALVLVQDAAECAAALRMLDSWNCTSGVILGCRAIPGAEIGYDGGDQRVRRWEDFGVQNLQISYESVLQYPVVAGALKRFLDNAGVSEDSLLRSPCLQVSFIMQMNTTYIAPLRMVAAAFHALRPKALYVNDHPTFTVRAVRALAQAYRIPVGAVVA